MSDPIRCGWCRGDDQYEAYHDREWGVPCRDDAKLLEFLVLEGAQAGLSWLTVLRKRANYRRAFAGFDPAAVAAFDEHHIAALMHDSGLVRNRRKIEAAIHNARCFLDIQARFGSFAHYFWGFCENRPIVNQWHELRQVPATTPLSDTISRDMKQRGFRFFGSTICYAHMQAMGMVNDHLVSCHRHQPCLELARAMA